MSIEQEVEEFARNMINFHGFRFIEGFACLIPDQAKYPKNEGLYLWGFSEKRMRFETKVEKFHAPARIQRMADMLGVPEKEYKKQFLVLLQDYLTILKNLGFTNIGKGVHLFGKTRIHNLQGDIKLFENNFDRLKQLEQITLNNPILTFVEEHAYFDVNNQDTLVWDSSFGNKPSSKTSKVAKKATATKVTKSTKATVTKNTKTTAAKVTKGTKATVAKVTKPAKTTAAKVTKGTKATVAKVTKPAKTTAAKVTKSTKATVTKVTKPAKTTAAKVTKSTKATVAKVTKPVKKTTVKVTKNTKATAAKVTKPVKTIAAKVTKPVKTTAAKVTKPVKTTAAKVTKPVKTTAAKVTKPVKTTAAKVTKTTKTVVAAKPKTSAVSQTRNISKITLADKLKKIAEGQPETTPEGEARKKSWDKQINNLYKKVETWLSEYSKGGYISFDTSSDSFELNLVGGHQVIFQPIEMNILGAMGRVDVYHRGYPPHKVMLLLHDKGSSKYHWELWKGLKKDEQVAFNKITLEGLLDQWIDS